MRPRHPRVTVVVLSYRSDDDTVACVDSLRRSHFLDLEIVVVDNAPRGAAHDRLRAAIGRGATVVASGDNLGYAAGNNIGLRRALELRADYAWILNPDTRVEPDTLVRLVDTADEIGDIGVLGPRVLARGTSGEGTVWSDGGVVDAARAGATSHLGLGRTTAQRPARGPRDVDYVTGASMLLRCAAVVDVGLLPEEYFLYFEETAYCRSVRARGWRTMVDDRAAVLHLKRSSGHLPTTPYLYYMTRNRLQFASRELGIEQAAALADHSRSFLAPWRERVAARAPEWIDGFDTVVAAAVEDAAAGVVGRRADLDSFGAPVLAEDRAGDVG